MVLRPIITWIEVIMGVGLGALIASRLPIPMELDAKDTKKEFKRVVAKRKQQRADVERNAKTMKKVKDSDSKS
jgi:hypothetical protein